jgi:hypothetical protein
MAGNSTTYKIRVKGHLGPTWAAWFEGMSVKLLSNGESELSGDVCDDAALHGVLVKIRDLGLPLVSVRRMPRKAEQ